MDILLDTHMLIWALSDDERLPEKAREIISDPENQIYYSTASIQEISIKNKKWPEEVMFTAKEISDASLDSDFENLPIFNKHIFQMENLNKKENTPKHNDPFDLILLAQAKRSYMKFLTHDHAFEYYDEDCIIIA